MHKPSRTYFPQQLQERAAWFENYKSKMQAHGTSLGFAAPELAQVVEDNDLVQFLARTATQIQAFTDAVIAFRRTITEDEPGQPTPVFPADMTFDPPPIPATGIWRRVTENVLRIRAAKSFTPELGAEFQIMRSQEASINLQEVKPVIKATESFNEYKFNVSVSRFGVPSFKVQIQRNGNGAWHDAAYADSNPCEVTVIPTSPGEPERVLVRAILLRKNEPVGEPSDPTYVTVNP